MRKIFLFISAVMMSVLSLQASERVVWSGSQPISWAPAVYDGITLEVYNLQGLAVGDVIKVYGTPAIDPASVQYQLKYKAGSNWTWTDLSTTVEENVGSYMVESATIATEIAERGLIVTGQGYDVTKITVATNDIQEEVWHQDALRIFYVDGSDNYSLDTYNSIDISAIRPGYTLKVYTENPEEYPSYQLQFKDGVSWDVWKTIANSADANGVVSHVIDSVGQAVKLRDRGLVVNGNNYSINRISVEKSRRYTLWDGTTTLNDGWFWLAWEGFLNTDINQLAEGDQIIITISATTGDNRQIKILNQETTGDSPTFGTIAENTALSEGEQEFVHELTAADVTAFKAGHAGIILQGANCTVTKVELLKASKNLEERTLWQYHGKQISWNNTYYPGEQFDTYSNISSDALTSVRTGTIIRVYITAGLTTYTYNVQYKTGTNWDWDDLIPSTDVNASVGETKEITYTVTSDKAALIAERGLVFKGQGYDLNRIVLENPVTTVSANLTVTAAGMATYILPFNVPSLPEGVQAYDLTNDGSDVITATEVNALTADKPVLIVAAAGEYEFVSEEGASDDISGKTDTYANGALVGTYQSIAAIPQSEDGKYNYVLQQHGDAAPAFYQVLSNDCALLPYRAYLSCTYVAVNGAPRRVRLVFNETNSTTGLDWVNNETNAAKVLRNGQLFIIRNGVEYNLNGQMVK